MTARATTTGLRPFRVVDVVRESRLITSFVLEPVDGEPLLAHSPGQHLTVHVRPVGSARPLERSFSLSRAHDAHRYRVSIKREPGGTVSRHMHDNVVRGDVVEVGAPGGVFTLDAACGRDPVVLLSAGVGATSVVPMLEALSIAHSDRDVWWIHGARRGADHVFADEVRRHVAALPRARSHVRYSRPDPSDVLGRGYDAPGHVTLGVLQELGVPREAGYFLCGPPSWMRELADGLLDSGVAPESLLLE